MKNQYLQYQDIEKRLSLLLNSNDQVLNQFDLSNFLKEMSIFIEENLNKPRTQLMNELSKGNIDFDKDSEILLKFKQLSLDYHKLTIIKEKLQNKIQE